VNLSDDEAGAVVRLAFEAGHLKRSKRTGWWVAGIKDPETVAEHSWRTAILAWFIATAEGADAERAVTIGVFHDLAETRTGDIEYVGRHYLDAAADEEIAADQITGLPEAMAAGMLAIIAQAEGHGGSLEAQCAHDADKLECLLQAREYQRQGHEDVGTWAVNMAAAVRTPTGRALAEAAMKVDPAEWWRDVAATWARQNGLPGSG
jgi:5'-deoxynucleotidase YfbR-like HD superfamily hydrolase